MAIVQDRKISQQAMQTIASNLAEQQGKGVIPVVRKDLSIALTASDSVTKIPSSIANEFYADLVNLLRSQIYEDGVDLEAFIGEIMPFKDTKVWANGQIEIIGKDLKTPDDGYAKQLAFDNVFNPVDREISTVFGKDNFKKLVRDKLDISVIQRAVNDTDAISFITDFQDKQAEDLGVQLYNDFIEFFQVAIGTFATIEIDTSEARQQRIVKAEKDAIAYLNLPQRTWNETGFIYARKPEALIVNRDPFVNNEIEVYLAANTFNPSYISTGIDLVKIPVYSETTQIYSTVLDSKKIRFQITLNEIAATNLDGFQITYSSREFYGFVNVPWLGGISVIEAATVPVIPQATFDNLSGTDPTTAGASDGTVNFDVTIENFSNNATAVLNPTAGTIPLTLADGANTDMVFENLPAGTYSIDVKNGTQIIETSDAVDLADPA